MSNIIIKLLVLKEIKNNCSVNLSGLTKKFGVSISTIRQIVKSLEQENLIYRAKKHRRAVCLTISGYGYLNSFHSDTTTGAESDL